MSFDCISVGRISFPSTTKCVCVGVFSMHAASRPIYFIIISKYMLSKKPWFCYYSLVAVLVVDPAAAATAACFAQYVRSVCVVHGRYTNWKRKRILSENTRQHLVVFGNENKQGIRRRQRREHCRKINEYSYNNNKKQWRFVSFAGRSQIRTLCVCVCVFLFHHIRFGFGLGISLLIFVEPFSLQL